MPTVLNRNVLLGRNGALVHSTISRLWFVEISSHKKETNHSFYSSYIFGERHVRRWQNAPHSVFSDVVPITLTQLTLINPALDIGEVLW